MSESADESSSSIRDVTTAANAVATARLRRLRTIFDAAVEQDPAAWPAVVSQLAADDATLQAEVLALLHRDAITDVRLSSPASISSTLSESFARLGVPDVDAGMRFGAYAVVREIGRGGMGVVYEAVRVDDQYRKRVAIKLVHLGLNSDVALARFRRERQILANLEHRNIATLLDGGITPDGRPFLVMEFVEGEPITSWCDARRIGVRQRLSLFRQACAAVQHAHKNLVVHRDLKPANILVANDGTVKLLDFGIATLLSVDDNPLETPITQGASRAFTPEYASPEQLRGELLTTASDVYSLGVVLFELMTGQRPHKPASKALIDVERAVLESPIPKPSSLATLAAATARGERSAHHLQRQLDGDIDAIVLRALASDINRRYVSVDAIADDLRRQLDGLPVQAQPDWMGYRVGKFVRRNAAAVGASLLVVIALVGGVITTTLQARRAHAAQLQSEHVSGFLRDILSSVRPSTGGRDVPVSEVLDSAAIRLRVELVGEPVTRAQLERVLASSYLALGRYDESAELLRDALTLRPALGKSLVVGILNDLGVAEKSRGNFLAADSVLKSALALLDSTTSRPDTMRAVLNDNLGSVAHERGDLQGAARLHGIGLSELQKLLNPDDDRIAIAMNNVAVARGDLNELAAAESLHREVVGILRRNHKTPSPIVADAENQLAGVLDMQGKTLAAESVFVRVLALRKQLLGTQHPDYAFTMFAYAMNQMDKPDYARAIAACAEVLALRGKSVLESHPSIASCLQTTGRAKDILGDTAGGRIALEESLGLRTTYLPAGSWLIANSESVVGEHFTRVKEYAKAEQLLLPAHATLLKQMGGDSPRTQASLKRLVALYEAWGRPDRATVYRKLLR